MRNARLFFEVYGGRLAQGTVVDVGARDVDGSVRSVCPPCLGYIGVDLEPGPGVDVVLEEPYRLPFGDGSIDIVVCSSVFEHTEMFWLLFIEILRILKPKGLFYLNVPSNGPFHRYPVDCWRFYPDSGHALVNWAKLNGYEPVLLESFIGKQDEHMWCDFVSVFLKDGKFAGEYTARMVHLTQGFSNATIFGHEGYISHRMVLDDMEKLVAIKEILEENRTLSQAGKLAAIKNIIGVPWIVVTDGVVGIRPPDR